MIRVALVTGGATGIGLAIARGLAQAGHEVIVADLVEPAHDETSLHARVLDVSDEAAVNAFYGALDREFGRLDILVNNAGIMSDADDAIERLSLAAWERTLRVNLSGTYLMCQGAVPLMRRGVWGRIVNMSSRTARGRNSARNPAYPASKAAVIGLSRVLANEVGTDGITVNCVAPSTVDTAMTRSGTEAEAYFERQAASTALGRLGTAEDVAAAVCYLCGEEAGFVTGLVLDVNGGSYMP